MLTTVASSTTISCATATTTRTSQRRSAEAARRSWTADDIRSYPRIWIAAGGGPDTPGAGRCIAPKPMRYPVAVPRDIVLKTPGQHLGMAGDPASPGPGDFRSAFCGGQEVEDPGLRLAGQAGRRRW